MKVVELGEEVGGEPAAVGQLVPALGAERRDPLQLGDERVVAER